MTTSANETTIATKRRSLVRKVPRTASQTSASSHQRGSSKHRTPANSNIHGKQLRTSRILFATVILLVTVGLGLGTFFMLSKSETNLAKEQYSAIVDRALQQASQRLLHKRWAAATLAQVIGSRYPNADQDWPFVTLPDFEAIVEALLQASDGTDIGYGHFVVPEQIPAFEDFAYEFYTQNRRPTLSNETVYSSFGFGVYGLGPRTEQVPDGRYRDTTGETRWGSQNTLLTPLLDTNGENVLRMYNLHSEPNRGRAMDDLLACSQDRHEQRLANPSATIPPAHACGVVTGVLPIPKRNQLPGAVIFQPIYPVLNETIVTGFVPTLFLFEELLEEVFADTVSGVDCVIHTTFTKSNERISATFSIVDGTTHFRGYNDTHNQNYEDLGRSVLLTPPELFTENAPRHSLIIYPNAGFYNAYETNNPAVATIVVAGITFVTLSLVFLLYDYYVRREFRAKRQLLEARRQFMRYVSHEVRTPLNSVSLGLRILQFEMNKALGYEDLEAQEAAVLLHEELTRAEEHPEDSHPEGAGVVSRRMVTDWADLTLGIQGNANSAVDVLTDLLNYDKIESGGFKMELSVISVCELVKKVAAEFRLPTSGKRIDYDVSFFAEQDGERREDQRCAEKDTRLVGDSVRLTQVLRNLISNAVKFTPENGSLRVETTLFPSNCLGSETTFALENVREPLTAHSNGHVQIVVTDSGVGMSKEQVSALFSEHVQFNVNRLQSGQGSGLGLYIAKSIVEQHQGTLVAASEGLGTGASFTLTLPLWDVPERVAAETADVEAAELDHSNPNAGSKLTNANDSKGLRILIVDDVASNRKLLGRLLKYEGHISEHAANGEVAVEMIRQSMETNQMYDTVLMDYEMPILNGPDAVRQIRSFGCDCFIVGITGNMLPDDVAYFKSCGANAVFGKPVKISDLNQVWMEYGISGGAVY